MLEVRTRAARSVARWTVPESIETVRERLIQEIAQSSRARLTANTGALLHASVQGNAFSWGERMTVSLTPIGSSTGVSVSTRPVWPITLFDWGEGERDIRLLYAAVPGADDRPRQQAVIDGRPAKLGRTSALSEPLGWFVMIMAGLMLILALIELTTNFERVWSWLPLLIVTPFALIVVAKDLWRR